MVLCDHTDVHEFERNDITSYFSQSYYDNNPHAPRHCSSCGPDKLLGIDIKVNATHPVYQCKNCRNKNQPCNHAFCNSCWTSIALNDDTVNNNKGARKKNVINRLCN